MSCLVLLPSRPSALNQLMALVARTPEVQVHAVQRMWLALKDTPTQPLLMTVCLWCVGEFGDLLVAQSLDGTAQGRVEPEEVIALLETLLGPHQPEMVRQHALTAAMKLTTRFPPQVLLPSLLDFAHGTSTVHAS